MIVSVLFLAYFYDLNLEYSYAFIWYVTLIQQLNELSWNLYKIGAMIITGDRYEVQETTKSMFEVKMMLIIKKFQAEDSGRFSCIAKNSIGDVESTIKLHGRYQITLFLLGTSNPHN